MADEGEIGAREVDALPAPPRRLRSIALALMTVTAAACALLGGSLFSEARYAFEADKPVDIGNLAAAELGPNLVGRYVRARVALEGKPSIAFHRLGETERRIALAAPRAGEGSGQVARFVEFAVPRDAGARFVPPRLVAGRLERVGELGLRHRGLSGQLEALAAEPGAGSGPRAPGEHSAAARGWVLVDGEEPHAADWAVALELLLAAFFTFNVVSIVRIIRRQPVA